MKKLVGALLVTLMASQSFAAAREFRILSNRAQQDVALAWGIKGQVIDFEQMDQKNRDEQWAYIVENEANLENYLIDLKTNQILSVIRAGNAGTQRSIVEFSQMMNTNNNDLSLVYDAKAQIGMTLGYAKWTGGLEHLFALKKNAQGHNEVIGSCTANCEESIILPALKAQMTKEQIKDYESYSAANTFYTLTRDEKTGRVLWNVKVTAENPKFGGSTAYSGLMELTFANGQFTAVFGKVVKVKN